MANPEHLAILNQGIVVWNQWRRENSKILPDLSEANLRKADLQGANLNGANLRKADLYGATLEATRLARANLRRANLRRANLRRANLQVANLRRADLSGAELERADLSGADLTGTNLRTADLTGTNLQAANLSGANLSGANLAKSYTYGTIFANVDLSKSSGLEMIEHWGPSTIGIDTLYKSQGKIPEVFLRGCGVPENMIEYARSLTASPIQYYSCFISYSHKDEDFAKRLWEGLQSNNVRCWFAPHDLPIGAKTRPAIDEAIRVHDKLLLILSEHSVASNWVEHEAEHALDLETERDRLVLFPVRLDEAVMNCKAGWASNVKRQRNIGDFTRWKDHDTYKAAFDRLLRDLKT